MTTNRVEHIAEQVMALCDNEREEFFCWLSDYQLEQSDAWDEEIAQDSRSGGRLEVIMDRARRDIAGGRIQPLDEILGDS